MPTDMELFGGTMMSPIVDPYAVYRRLRQEQPVICVEGLLGRDHLVTRYHGSPSASAQHPEKER